MTATPLIDCNVGCAIQSGVTGASDTLMEVIELRQLCGRSGDTQPAACKTGSCAVQRKRLALHWELCDATGHIGTVQCRGSNSMPQQMWLYQHSRSGAAQGGCRGLSCTDPDHCHPSTPGQRRVPWASFRFRPLLKLSAQLSSLYCLRPLESLMSKSSPADGE